MGRPSYSQPMRVLRLLCYAAMFSGALATAADRNWKTGVWATASNGRVYVIESASEFISGEAPEAGAAPLSATSGSAVQYAIEQQTLYVLDGEKVEHPLRLVGSSPKYSTSYQALGGGHYIKAVSPGGTRVTLEDGSRWDMDPRQYFAVADWQPDDLISVRRSTSDKAFAFEVDNTSRDDGALANRLTR